MNETITARDRDIKRLVETVKTYETLFVKSLGFHPSGREKIDNITHIRTEKATNDGRDAILFFWEGRLHVHFVGHGNTWEYSQVQR